MGKKFVFHKYVGAGNDFIIFDNRDNSFFRGRERENVVERICKRRLNIGADGVLLVEKSDKADFKMRYYNADGKEAETCGNGSRCIAKFAYLMGAAKERMKFETKAGLYSASIEKDIVVVSLTDAKNLQLDILIAIDGYNGKAHFLNMGVPHVVVILDDIEKINIIKLGSQIRYYDLFKPDGANANFVEIIDKNNFKIRTYERGVEDETLSCGTGSVSSSIISTHLGLVEPPVSVHTRDKNILTVDFKLIETGATDVKLGGEARLVFKGEIEI